MPICERWRAVEYKVALGRDLLREEAKATDWHESDFYDNTLGYMLKRLTLCLSHSCHVFYAKLMECAGVYLVGG